MLLTSMGRGCDLKFNMLKEVQDFATTGKLYLWVDHLVEIIKHICVKFQEEGAQI